MEHYRPRQFDHTFVGEIPYINRDAISTHLATVSRLDKRALMDTLVPHRALPMHDPGRYVIEAHRPGELNGSVRLDSSYELGVVFARSLLRSATAGEEGYIPPVVSQFDEAKKQLIDDYLRQAPHRKASNLTKMDWQIHPYLERAVELFCRRCDVVVPELMLEGDEEVKRGVHDYLSVITLLESDTENQRRNFYKRLGVAGAGAFIAYLLTSRRWRRSAS